MPISNGEGGQDIRNNRHVFEILQVPRSLYECTNSTENFTKKQDKSVCVAPMRGGKTSRFGVLVGLRMIPG